MYIEQSQLHLDPYNIYGTFEGNENKLFCLTEEQKRDFSNFIKNIDVIEIDQIRGDPKFLEIIQKTIQVVDPVNFCANLDLETEGGKFSANKLLLAAYSKYFKAILQGEFQEKKSNVLHS